MLDIYQIIRRALNQAMAPKRGGSEGSKKAAGQARKAETAANKKASKEREEEQSEAAQWEKGAKDSGKK